MITRYEELGKCLCSELNPGDLFFIDIPNESTYGVYITGSQKSKLENMETELTTCVNIESGRVISLVPQAIVTRVSITYEN